MKTSQINIHNFDCKLSFTTLEKVLGLFVGSSLITVSYVMIKTVKTKLGLGKEEKMKQKASLYLSMPP